MNIVFHVGYSAEAWDATALNKYGLGGTEQCVVNIAEQLSLLHYNVFVTGEVISGKHNNVEYINMYEASYDTIKAMPIDFLIGVSYVHFLKEFEGCRVNKRFFWLHNTEPHLWWKGEELEVSILDRVDEFILLSEWHASDFHKRYGFEKPINVIGNGINLSKVKESNKKEKTVLYTSHAERGLSKVLDSKLYEKLGCNLKVTTPKYGEQYIKDFYINDYARKNDKYEYLGSLSLDALYEEMDKAMWWHYPTDYEETYCITALEMLAHGVTPIIEDPIAGLEETLNGFYVNSYQASKGITIDHEKAFQYVKSRDWSVVVKEWKTLLLEEEPSLTAYVITLEEHNNLAERVQKELGIAEVYVHHGVNGNNISDDTDYTLFDWKISSDNNWWNRNLKSGEVGCMLSHIEVLEEAYEDGRDWVLVLEDDFKVVGDLDISSMPKDFDVCYLGRNLQGVTEIIDDTYETAGYSYNTHAILYRRSGIEKLLQGNPRNFIMPWDEYISATHSYHPRKDLDFIWKDIDAIAFRKDIITQTSTPMTSLTENSKEVVSITNTKDWDAWCKNWLTYEALTGEWDLVVDEPITDVFTFPLFKPEFCKQAIELANMQNKWQDQRHEFYPTIDVLLESIGLNEAYQRVLKEYVYPCAIHMWRLEGSLWPNMESENFMIKYTEEKQGHLSLHHDFSDISCVLALNEEYEGVAHISIAKRNYTKERPDIFQCTLALSPICTVAALYIVERDILLYHFVDKKDE